MKLFKILPITMMLLATSCGSSLPVQDDPGPAPSENAKYTVLVYMCGANLESDFANETRIDNGYYIQKWDGRGLATMDIDEIISVAGKPDDVNIVIQTGGAVEWTSKKYGKYGSYSISSKKLQRHHVYNNKIHLDESLPDDNMGKSSTLQNFLEYGLTTYPAQKTALILWNHGGGLQGVCFDEKHYSDGLTADEVCDAVDGALKNTGHEGEKLEWIGYDACLMAVQDIAEKNSHYFNYMVAAQETESGYGWDYARFIDDIYRDEPTPVILKEIVDGFIAYNGGVNSSYNDQTLAYYNLSYMSPYVNAWQNLSYEISTKLRTTNKYTFRNLLLSGKYYAGNDYIYFGQFDVKDFMSNLSNSYTFNPGSSYIQAVLDAHANLVEYSKCGKAAGESYGLSFYWDITDTARAINGYHGFNTAFSNWESLSYNYGGSETGYY